MGLIYALLFLRHRRKFSCKKCDRGFVVCGLIEYKNLKFVFIELRWKRLLTISIWELISSVRTMIRLWLLGVASWLVAWRYPSCDCKLTRCDITSGLYSSLSSLSDPLPLKILLSDVALKNWDMKTIIALPPGSFSNYYGPGYFQLISRRGQHDSQMKMPRRGPIVKYVNSSSKIWEWEKNSRIR